MEYLQRTLDTLHDITASFCFMCVAKIPIAIIGGLFIYLFGIENADAVVALVVIVCFDFATGISASYINKEALESKRAVKTAVKIVFYGLFVSSSFLTEGIVPGNTLIDVATISFLALTELISIMENLGKMGYQVPLMLLGKLRTMRKEL